MDKEEFIEVRNTPKTALIDRIEILKDDPSKEETMLAEYIRNIEGKKVPGMKFDEGKRRWGLLPWNAVEEIVKVLEKALDKYVEGSWKHVEPFEKRYSDALFRHVIAYMKGERIDTESGLSHMAHAATNALFLIWKDIETDGKKNSR